MSRPHPFDQRKSAKAGPKVPRGNSEIHYGKSHAQTEELYQAHQMEHQLEELANLKPEEDEKLSSSAADPMDRILRSVPIGALPESEEVLTPNADGLADLFEDGRRSFRLLESSARDLWIACSSLLRLPGEAVRLAVTRFKPHHA